MEQKQILPFLSLFFISCLVLPAVSTQLTSQKIPSIYSLTTPAYQTSNVNGANNVVNLLNQSGFYIMTTTTTSTTSTTSPNVGGFSRISNWQLNAGAMNAWNFILGKISILRNSNVLQVSEQIVNGRNYQFIIQLAYSPTLTLRYSLIVYASLNNEFSLSSGEFVELPQINTQGLVRVNQIGSLTFINQIDSLIHSQYAEELRGYQILTEVWVQQPYYVLVYSNEQGRSLRITIIYDPIVTKIQTVQIQQGLSAQQTISNPTILTSSAQRPNYEININQPVKQDIRTIVAPQIPVTTYRPNFDFFVEKPNRIAIPTVALPYSPQQQIRRNVDITLEKSDKQYIPRIDTPQITTQVVRPNVDISVQKAVKQQIPRIDTPQITTQVVRPNVDINIIPSKIVQATSYVPSFEISLNPGYLISQLKSVSNPALIPILTESYAEDLDQQKINTIIQYIIKKAQINEDFSVLLINQIRYGIRIVISMKSSGALFEGLATYTYKNGDKSSSEVELLSWNRISSVQNIDPDVFTKYYPLDSNYITPQLEQLITRAFKNQEVLSKFQKIIKVEKRATFDGVYYQVVLDTVNNNRYQVGFFWIPENNYLEILKYQLVSSGYDASKESKFTTIPNDKYFNAAKQFIISKFGAIFSQSSLEIGGVFDIDQGRFIRLVFRSPAGRFQIILLTNLQTLSISVIRWEKIEDGYIPVDANQLQSDKVFNQVSQKAHEYCSSKFKIVSQPSKIEYKNVPGYNQYYKLLYSEPLPFAITVDYKDQSSSLAIRGMERINKW